VREGFWQAKPVLTTDFSWTNGITFRWHRSSSVDTNHYNKINAVTR
jgi:hypothetical protein